jgi:glyoxylase-like metal-dependent hydrolase (beta-lactamase superfamily II)
VVVHIVDPWFTVEQIDSNTYAISEYGHWEHVHSFLLIGADKAVLIDSGIGIDNIKRVTDQLTHLPITVVTTHVHWDHIGSHGEFDELYLHDIEANWLIHGIPGLPIEKVRENVSRDITIPVPETFNPEVYTLFKGHPTGTLTDGEILSLGNRTLEVIHTPGHSPGHICIHDKTNGYLFSGDILYEGTIFAFYPTTAPVDLVESLDKICQLKNLTKIYGSHNRLGLDPSVLKEVSNAIDVLRSNNLVSHGTGIHQFKTFSFHF